MTPAGLAIAREALALVRARAVETLRLAARFGAPFDALARLDARQVAGLEALGVTSEGSAPPAERAEEDLPRACARALAADDVLCERFEGFLADTTEPALAAALQRVLGTGRTERRALLARHQRAEQAHRCG